MQLVHDSELSSTPGTSLQRWTLNHLASASYTEPCAAQNGMVSNHALKTFRAQQSAGKNRTSFVGEIQHNFLENCLDVPGVSD